MKKLSSLLLAIVAVVMLAGSPTAQEPAVLTAAVGNNMNHVPSFVGVEKGIFLKHGVDLKLKVLGTGQEMAKALQAGEVQIIGSAYSNYPLAVERRHGRPGRGRADGRPERPVLGPVGHDLDAQGQRASRRSRTWRAGSSAPRWAAPPTSTSASC